MLSWLAILLVAVFGAYTYFGYTTATLTLKMRDPPYNWGDASNIYIHYSAIEIHRSDAGDKAGWMSLSEEGWIDLSTVIDIDETIGESSLEPGIYDRIRFEIIEARVTVNGFNKTASVASGKLNIQITNGGITLVGGRTSELLLDIEPTVHGSEKSGYRIIPAVKAIPE
jgi:hypothetical protein